MAIEPTTVCPRCGRQNVSRARFCAQCGLNLGATGADEVTRALRRNGRKTGTGLVLFLILLGLFLAAMGSLFRAHSCQDRTLAPRPRISTPYPQPRHPWHNERNDRHDRVRWHAEWQVER